MVVDDVVHPLGHVGERVTVGRQDVLQPGELLHPFQRAEEGGQRVIHGADAVDVGGDGGQYVVSRQQDPVGRVVEAEVVVRVARGVDGQPGSPAEQDLLAVDHRVGRLGDTPRLRSAGHVHLRPLAKFSGRWCGSGGAPWGGAAHHGSDPFDVLVVSQIQVAGVHLLVDRHVHPHRSEVGMGKDPGAVVIAETVHTAEVIGVAVGDHRGVDPTVVGAQLGQEVAEGVPRFEAGQAGVHQGESVGVLQRVTVDVAEAGHRDRELKPV